MTQLLQSEKRKNKLKTTERHKVVPKYLLDGGTSDFYLDAVACMSIVATKSLYVLLADSYYSTWKKSVRSKITRNVTLFEEFSLFCGLLQVQIETGTC